MLCNHAKAIVSQTFCFHVCFVGNVVWQESSIGWLGQNQALRNHGGEKEGIEEANIATEV